jgi:hypothetical protein
MAGKGTLRGRERELSALLAAGCRHRVAAKKLGVNQRTVDRYAVRADVKQMVREIRDRAASAAVGVLTEAMTYAARELLRLMRSGSEGVRLGACRTVLEYGIRVREHTELARRVAELENDADEPADASAALGADAGEPAGGPEHAGAAAVGPGGGADVSGGDAGPVASSAATSAPGQDIGPLFPAIG